MREQISDGRTLARKSLIVIRHGRIHFNAGTFVGEDNQALVVECVDVSTKKPAIAGVIVPILPAPATAVSGLERRHGCAAGHHAAPIAGHEDAVAERALLGTDGHLCELPDALAQGSRVEHQRTSAAGVSPQ